MRVLFTVMLLALGSCESHYRNYRNIGVEGLPFETVWELAIDSVRTEFRLDRSATDRGLRKIQTKWRTSLMAFGKGRRSRAVLEIVDMKGLAMTIRFYVEQQRSGDMGHQFQPREEDWESAGQAGNIEDRLRYHLSSRIAHAKGERAGGPEGVRTEDPMKAESRRK